MNSIKQIEVIYNNSLVGRLALTKEGFIAKRRNERISHNIH